MNYLCILASLFFFEIANAMDQTKVFSPYCLDQECGIYSPIAASSLDTRVSDQNSKDLHSLVSSQKFLKSSADFLSKGAQELLEEGKSHLNKTNAENIDFGNKLLDDWLRAQKNDTKSKIKLAKELITLQGETHIASEEEIEKIQYDQTCLKIDKINIDLALGINYIIRNNINFKS